MFRFSSGLVPLSLLLGAISLTAGPCTIANGCLSDRLWVVDPTGQQVDGMPVHSYNEVGDQIYYINTANLVDTSLYGHPTVMLEPPGFGAVSDVVGIVFVDGNLFLGFKSDSDSGVPVTFGTGSPVFIPELPHGTVDVTRYLTPQMRTAGFTAFFRSDVAETPEPATLALLGFGLATILVARKRVRT